MRLFKGRENAADRSFWDWWATGRDRVAAAIASGSFEPRLIDEISRAVQTIDPSMAWELGPGQSAQHAFCISPEGQPGLRQAAIRWLGSAPPADAIWEYHASKQPVPNLGRLEVGGNAVNLAAMRAATSWDATRRRLDVRLWHPEFTALPEAARIQVGFVYLDQLLGEEDVERWIGSIDLMDALVDGTTPEELRAEVDRHRTEAPESSTWVLGTLEDAGSNVIVMADAALKRIDYPFADHHVEIGVVLEGPNGLPNDDEAAQLNAEEDDLVARLQAVAVYAGRTTRPGLRAMHFVAEDPERMRPAIDAWAEGLPPRRIKVNFEHDMGWEFQRQLGVR